MGSGVLFATNMEIKRPFIYIVCNLHLALLLLFGQASVTKVFLLQKEATDPNANYRQ